MLSAPGSDPRGGHKEALEWSPATRWLGSPGFPNPRCLGRCAIAPRYRSRRSDGYAKPPQPLVMCRAPPASALSMGRSGRLGLLLTDLENQFYQHVMAPMHHALDEVGYQLVLMTESVRRQVPLRIGSWPTAWTA